MTDQEAIARIIDPEAWESVDRCVDQLGDCDSAAKICASSLAKADAILAFLHQSDRERIEALEAALDLSQDTLNRALPFLQDVEPARCLGVGSDCAGGLCTALQRCAKRAAEQTRVALATVTQKQGA